MNDKSIATFDSDGGEALIGTNLLDCHREPSRTQVAQMLAKELSNTYTIQKKGVKKIIIQTPWYQDGKFAGLVELSVEIPEEMPHFVRR